MRTSVLAVAFGLAASACGPRLAARDLDGLAVDLEQRGMALHYGTAPDGDALPDWVAERLASPLDLQGVAEVALGARRDLRAALLEVAAVRAEARNGSGVANPSVEWERITHDGQRHDAVHGGVSLSSLLLAPARWAAGAAAIPASQAEALETALQINNEARRAAVGVALAEQRVLANELLVQIADAAVETAAALYEVGNLSDAQLLAHELAAAEARVEWAEANHALLVAREEATVAMGLWGEGLDWQVDGPAILREVGGEPDLTRLETDAIASNLRLSAMRYRFESAARHLRVESAAAWLPDVGVGLAAEGEDGHLAVGPVISATLPVFSQGTGMRQATLARLEAARALYVQAAVEVRSAARTVSARVQATSERQSAVCDELVPLRSRTLEEGVRRYNAMELGAFDLLMLRADEVRAELACSEARAASRLAQIDAVGVWAGLSQVAPEMGGITVSRRESSGGHGGH